MASRVLVLVLAAAAGCQRDPGRVWIADDGVKVGADGRILTVTPLPGYERSNPAWDGGRITLAAARGETVAFQVLVAAGTAGLKAVDVRAPELRRDGGGSIDAHRFALFREWYVPVTIASTSPGGSAGPGEYPDALVPRETPRWGLPVDVAPRRTQGIWVDCAIPADAPPGNYRGTLEVVAGARTLARHEVSLTVHPFTMPALRHLRWRVGYTGWEAVPRHFGVQENSVEWLAMERELYRLLWQDHRIVPTTHYQDAAPETRGAGATLALGWEAFDRRFGSYLDGSAFPDAGPIRMFSLPVNLHHGWPWRLSASDPTDAEMTTLTVASRLVAQHWDERGWNLDDAFAYVADEPGREKFEALRKACAAIHRGDARIRTSVALYQEFGRDAARVVEQLRGFVTAWDIAGDHADLPALRARQAAGDRVGIYQGGEPFEGGEALDNDGLSLVTWPWIAWRYGLDSLFLYNATEWDYARVARTDVRWSKLKREIWENPLNQSWPTNSQGVLVYPGQYVGIRGVVASIRVKQVRRGMQDYEYLWLARERGEGPAADAIARRLIPRALHQAGPLGRGGGRGSWERDPRVWAAARAELAGVIAK